MEELTLSHGIKINLKQETTPEYRKEINSFINKVWSFIEGVGDSYGKKYEDKIFMFYALVTNPKFMFDKILEESGIKIEGDIYNMDEVMLLNQLDEDQKTKFNRKKMDYEILQICDEDGNNLVYENGMPVLEFRYRCHQKGELKEVMNFHKGVSWILFNPKDNSIFLAIKNKGNALKGKYEIGGGHVGVRTFETTIIDELWEELRLKNHEYELPQEFHTTSLSDNFQNQVTKIYEVIIKDEEFLNRVGDGESIGGKFYSIDQIIGFIKGQIEIDGKIYSVEIVPHHRFSLLEYIYAKGLISQNVYLELKKQVDDELQKEERYIRVIKNSNRSIKNRISLTLINSIK